jgi:hypothetical protein
LWKKGNPKDADEHFVNALVDAFFHLLNLASWLLPSTSGDRSWAILFKEE